MTRKNNLFNYIVGKVEENVLNSPAGAYYQYGLAPDLDEYMDRKGFNSNQRNNFKHIAGTAQAINDMGVPRALGYAVFKEPRDMFRGDSLQDTIQDYKNDFRAFKLHFQNPNLDGEKLYDYVNDNYIH